MKDSLFLLRLDRVQEALQQVTKRFPYERAFVNTEQKSKEGGVEVGKRESERNLWKNNTREKGGRAREYEFLNYKLEPEQSCCYTFTLSLKRSMKQTFPAHMWEGGSIVIHLFLRKCVAVNGSSNIALTSMWLTWQKRLHRWCICWLVPSVRPLSYLVCTQQWCSVLLAPISRQGILPGLATSPAQDTHTLTVTH